MLSHRGSNHHAKDSWTQRKMRRNFFWCIVFFSSQNFRKNLANQTADTAISTSMTDVSPQIVSSSALDWAHPVVREWFFTRLCVPTEPRAEPPTGETITISAADPLNLVGIIVRGAKVLAISSRFVTYRDGVALEASQPLDITAVEKAG